MTLKVYCTSIMLLLTSFCYAQQAQRTAIYTGDIVLFWQAYDQVVATADTDRQAAIIQRQYLDKASEGLKDFTKVRPMKAMDWVRSINRHPHFWASVRSKTLLVSSQIRDINRLMQRFKALYPAFKRPSVYYTIGCIKTGGVTRHDRIMIGTEIIVADSTVNVSGLSAFLQQTFRLNKGVNYLTIHETVHTQQKGIDDDDDSKLDLLAYCLREGAADFVAGIVLRQPVVMPYTIYGKAHEAEIWQQFKKEMNGKDPSAWLYNGGTVKKAAADLGYFVGYQICKAYYDRAPDKRQALKDIIELDYNDTRAVHGRLADSGYDPR